MAIAVKPRFPGERVDEMLRRLKKAMEREQFSRDAARHLYFKSPGERRRSKRMRARKLLQVRS